MLAQRLGSGRTWIELPVSRGDGAGERRWSWRTADRVACQVASMELASGDGAGEQRTEIVDLGVKLGSERSAASARPKPAAISTRRRASSRLAGLARRGRQGRSSLGLEPDAAAVRRRLSDPRRYRQLSSRGRAHDREPKGRLNPGLWAMAATRLYPLQRALLGKLSEGPARTRRRHRAGRPHRRTGAGRPTIENNQPRSRAPDRARTRSPTEVLGEQPMDRVLLGDRRRRNGP
jgi:hypothetical protein